MQITTIASSSSGNCSLVSHNGTHILIDAGISFRRIRHALADLGLEPSDLSAILVTHGHSDHVKGLQTLTKNVDISIFSTWETLDTISPVISPRASLISIEADREFYAGDMGVRPFKTSHDAPGSLGFVVMAGGKKLAFATDLGIVTPQVANATKGADVALIESNHDITMLKCGRYHPSLKRRVMSDYGHLSNKAGAAFALFLAKAGAKKLILAHLSKENNTAQLAYDCTYDCLTKEGANVGLDIELHIAPREEIGNLIVV